MDINNKDELDALDKFIREQEERNDEVIFLDFNHPDEDGDDYE